MAGESRVRVKIFKNRPWLEENEKAGSILNGLLKAKEGAVLFVEAGIDVCEVESRDVAGLRKLLQLAQHLAGPDRACPSVRNNGRAPP